MSSSSSPPPAPVPSTTEKNIVIDPEIIADAPKLSPEEEAALLSESNTLKATANTQFAASSFREALNTYTQALTTLPPSYPYELSILHSNISATHLKLQEYPLAIKSATSALTLLETLITAEQTRLKSLPTTSKFPNSDSDSDSEIEEIISPGAKTAAPAPPADTLLPLHRLRCKSLLRRARARVAAPSWQNLTGAQEDFTLLSSFRQAGTSHLSAVDEGYVAGQLRELPGRIKKAQEEEVAEMWGKLKGLGDGLLRPFGLSTDNFQIMKDEKTGGYSMNFAQNPGK